MPHVQRLRLSAEGYAIPLAAVSVAHLAVCSLVGSRPHPAVGDLAVPYAERSVAHLAVCSLVGSCPRPAVGGLAIPYAETPAGT